MFKNLTDRITSAITPSTSRTEREKIETLRGMGFTEEQSRNALEITGDWNVTRALEMLLSQQKDDVAIDVASSGASTDVVGFLDLTDEEGQLQKAMEESLISERQRTTKPTNSAKVNAKTAERKESKRKVAASAIPMSSSMAGHAAVQRLEQSGFGTKPKGKKGKTPAGRKAATARTSVTGIKSHIPTERGIKAPAPLQSKSKEEQITRCACRLSPYPLAVDTLLRALTELKSNPKNPKFRKIDKTNPGFRRALDSVPGAEDLLVAVNFQPRSANMNELILNERDVDVALLWMATSALEQSKLSDEYVVAKKRAVFHKIVKDIQDGRDTGCSKSIEEETVARAAYMSRCPSEPPAGRGAVMHLNLAGETFSRRFDGDDTLRDVVHWIGGHGSLIPEKIVSREWCLVDLNRFPVAPVGCSDLDLNRTLQAIGCWPSGKLELRESDKEWRERGQSTVTMGSARGLGAHS